MYILDDFPTINSGMHSLLKAMTPCLTLYSFDWRLPRNQRSTPTGGSRGLDSLYISCLVMGFVRQSPCKTSLFGWTQMRAQSTQDHSQAKELEEESWLAKAYGYEQWRVIFARSLLAWHLHIDVNRTEQLGRSSWKWLR